MSASQQNAAQKLKVALYWTTSCGGCDVAVLDVNEKILKVADACDIVFWPVAVDAKYESLDRWGRSEIDLCIVNGGIRNSEQVEIVRRLREKSKIMLALGSCACFGGIPALINLYSLEEMKSRVYAECPSVKNRPEADRAGGVEDGAGPIPGPACRVPEGELRLPALFQRVYRLDEVVPVEYFLPGCPPPPELIESSLMAAISGNLPEIGTVLAGKRTVCDTCERARDEKKVKRFKRVHETASLDPGVCLLEQGILCCGPATRDGCGARCIKANMPCRGCFGPTDAVPDHGARLMSMIATVLESNAEAEIRDELGRIPDPVGTFYRFGLAAALLPGRQPAGDAVSGLRSGENQSQSQPEDYAKAGTRGAAAG